MARADFAGQDYGVGYLTLVKHEQLVLQRRWPEEPGWAFGSAHGEEGWFPSAFWKPVQETSAAKAICPAEPKPSWQELLGDGRDMRRKVHERARPRLGPKGSPGTSHSISANCFGRQAKSVRE